MFTRGSVCGLAILATLFALAHGDDKPPRKGPRVAALNGPVLLVFDDQQGGLAKRQFGIFRDEDDAPEQQFIEETFASFRIEGSAEPRTFLILAYNVTGEGAYNGFWLKTGNVNWENYKDGELVMLLRRLDPVADKIKRPKLGLKKDRPRDTRAVTRFKTELKVHDKDGQLQTCPVVVKVDEDYIKQQSRKGYFELRVPLRDFLRFSDELTLKRVSEWVLVFENTRVVPDEQCGALGIRAVVLTTKRGQSVDELVNPRREKKGDQ